MNDYSNNIPNLLQPWLKETALPLWLRAGYDDNRKTFHERLDFAARPVSMARRVMVQARQIYVYAHATSLGWIDARDVTCQAFETMVKSYWATDGNPGWVFSLGADGGLADNRRDFYAHAFVLLACAWVHKLTGDPEPIRIADQTLAFLDLKLPAASGGYLDDPAAVDSDLRQNPHMHLFESLLALFQVTGFERFIKRAEGIYALFLQHFFVRGPDILAEYFDQSWKPRGFDANGPSAILWEAGHHCEWVWLLARFAELRGEEVKSVSLALYNRAYRDGISDDSLIFDEMYSDGRVATPSRRAWPLTEAIKANVVLFESGDTAALTRIASAIERLFAEFLRPDGLWHDRLSPEGLPMGQDVPASTLYHVFLAGAEVDRVFGSGRKRL